MVASINENIRFYKVNDPYYYEVDNLPLIDLVANDKILRDELNLIILASTKWATQSFVRTKVQSAVGSLQYIDIEGAGIVVPNNVVDWVLGNGYVKLSDLDLTSYATYSWITNQQFINDAKLLTYGYGTSSWVLAQQYITENWVAGQLFATQTWVELKDYVTEQWIIDQGYTGGAATELSELADVVITDPASRTEGDILIHNSTSSKMEIGATAERILSKEYSVFHELSSVPNIMAVASSTTSTGSVYNTVTAQYTPLSGTVHSEIEYATLMFSLTTSDDTDGHMYFRRSVGYHEQLILAVAGSTATGTAGENTVVLKVPVLAVSTNEGKFKFDYRADTGSNVAHSISVIGVSTKDLVTIIV
tara:strand:- start:93 stop:1178 length:1086 start_codon:yes stop_codon:yes gene_type:complete